MTYPSYFNNLSQSLTSLSLDDCGLKGDFPTKVFSRPNLQILILAEYLGGLTAHFPESNWNSPLEDLVIVGTSFTGPLPESIGNLKSLRTLDLRYCNFTRPLPTSLGNLTQLTHLSAPDNQLTGPIPSQAGELPSLSYIFLQLNSLNGTIPSWLFTLPSLVRLDLSFNQLSGRVDEF
ncbi:hypothetical protein K2173_008932 [Erythroxylum novogranatense]|uniref:Uncharacterized protein n=1 Tax=Erythroxylum novogranatense TaxID=1862640 RepID=A0AAV8TUE8_9ROSI|nr:hypothetical protein K2173_008932 [Erythroxylum novogranatense]